MASTDLPLPALDITLVMRPDAGDDEQTVSELIVTDHDDLDTKFAYSLSYRGKVKLPNGKWEVTYKVSRVRRIA